MPIVFFLSMIERRDSVAPHTKRKNKRNWMDCGWVERRVRWKLWGKRRSLDANENLEKGRVERSHWFSPCIDRSTWKQTNTLTILHRKNNSKNDWFLFYEKLENKRKNSEICRVNRKKLRRLLMESVNILVNFERRGDIPIHYKPWPAFEGAFDLCFDAWTFFRAHN